MLPFCQLAPSYIHYHVTRRISTPIPPCTGLQTVLQSVLGSYMSILATVAPPSAGMVQRPFSCQLSGYLDFSVGIKLRMLWSLHEGSSSVDQSPYVNPWTTDTGRHLASRSRDREIVGARVVDNSIAFLGWPLGVDIAWPAVLASLVVVGASMSDVIVAVCRCDSGAA